MTMIVVMAVIKCDRRRRRRARHKHVSEEEEVGLGKILIKAMPEFDEKQT